MAFTTEKALRLYNVFMEHCLDGTNLSQYQFPEPKALISPFLREKSITIIASIRGVGKSWLQLFLTRQLIYGLPFCRWEWENFADVVLLDMEMLGDIESRWGLITKNIEYEPVGNFTVLSADALGMREQTIPNLTDPACREALSHLLRFTLPDGGVFIVDNVSAATPGRDENMKEGWDAANQWLLRLKWELGLTIILCCHLPKKGNTPRGTSGMEDSNDTTITLSNVGKPDHAHFRVEFTKHRFFHGESAAPFNLELCMDANGQLDFVSEIPKAQKSNKTADIVKLYASGMQQSDIVRTLGIDKGYVSLTIKNAGKSGHLTAKGKFTKAGEVVYKS